MDGVPKMARRLGIRGDDSEPLGDTMEDRGVKGGRGMQEGGTKGGIQGSAEGGTNHAMLGDTNNIGSDYGTDVGVLGKAGHWLRGRGDSRGKESDVRGDDNDPELLGDAMENGAKPNVLERVVPMAHMRAMALIARDGGTLEAARMETSTEEDWVVPWAALATSRRRRGWSRHV
ncbi:unnamed protein product [Ilex paraguariensis]|uniref:Uncharacterized protein n=1 Tax=Ilex paraguariensis TaxID=185542 RepID=A0ABC8RQL4_9AQUA